MSRNGGIAAAYAAAFMKRTAPNTGITLKILSNDTGYSDDTLANYRDDKTTIPGEAIRRIDAALAKRGFPGLILETYGADSPQSRVSSPQLAPPAASPPAGFSSSDDICWWATHEGTLHAASLGHAEFVRRYLGLPADTEADARRFAIDHLGWLAATRYADGRLQIDGNPAQVSHDAAGRLADWLDQQGNVAAQAPMFQEAVSDAASLARLLRDHRQGELALGWTSERLPESSVTDPNAKRLWKAVHDAGIERANLLEIADRHGLIDRCSLFMIGDSTATSIHVGSSLKVDRAAVIGRPLLARRDLDYARRLNADLMEAREGPTVRKLRLNPETGYRRLIFTQPAGPQAWQALTMSYDITAPAGFQLA
jgi:hypothetical protein